MAPTILSTTREMLDIETSEMSARMILVHKTKSRNFDRMFRTVSVDIDSGMKKALIENARGALEGVAKNAGSITEFSDPANANSYVAMDPGVLPSLVSLLGELKTQTGHHGSSNYDELKEKGIGCLVLKSRGRRAFVFFNTGKNQLRPDKYIVSRLDHEQLTLHDGKLIVLERDVFAVYYENLEKLLIISYRSAKKLLGLNEQFRSKCVSILDEKLGDLVTFEGADTAALLSNMTTNEKMVKMDSRGAFEGASRETLDRWNRFYKSTPLEKTSPIRLNADGKAVIGSRDDLDMLLCVLNNEVVEPVTDRRSYALAPSKKSLRVSQRKARPPGGATA